MEKKVIILFEELNRIHELLGIDTIANKHLVVVDIQPEYEKNFKHFLYDFIKFINENIDNFSQLTFLYNGHDTLGMIDEPDYKIWWHENGLDENITYNIANYYDKGYAFFRYCMDESIDEISIINLVKYMLMKEVNDTRELDQNFWDEFIDQYGHDDIRELMEFSGDCIYIPDLMDELSNYNNIILCGGHIRECLKEVEIALNVLNKPYNVLTKYLY